MNRIQVALRAGAALAAIAVGASAAHAQSTVPTVDTAQATPVTTVGEKDIIVTGSRIRHNPLDQDAPRAAVVWWEKD